MKDLGEDFDVDEQRKKIEAAQARRHLAIRALGKHRDGRDLLWFIIESANPYASVMRYDAQERCDPMRTAYAEGFRGHGSLVMAEIMAAAPEVYVLMLSENRNVKTLENINE